jgi:hypothetical protein
MVNQGFAPPAGRRVPIGPYPIVCGGCGGLVPEAGAHIVCSPVSPDLHVMFCPGCCPMHGEAP